MASMFPEVESYIANKYVTVGVAKEVCERARRILLQHGAQENFYLAIGLIVYAYEILKQYNYTITNFIELCRWLLNAYERIQINMYPSKTELIEDD